MDVPQCNTYFEPTAIQIGSDVDFDAIARLALRSVGGTVVDATVVSSVAYSHTAPMLCCNKPTTARNNGCERD